MITIEIPTWAFWMLLSLFVLNMVLSEMLRRVNRDLSNTQHEHTNLGDVYRQDGRRAATRVRTLTTD